MTLKIDNKQTEVELYSGNYSLYFLGGFWVKFNQSFKISITDVGTKDHLIISEYFLKVRVYQDGQKAIRYFHFDVPKTGKYEITFSNFTDIKMKDSMLRSLRLFQKAKDSTNIAIKVEKK